MIAKTVTGKTSLFRFKKGVFSVFPRRFSETISKGVSEKERGQAAMPVLQKD